VLKEISALATTLQCSADMKNAARLTGLKARP